MAYSFWLARSRRNLDFRASSALITRMLVPALLTALPRNKMEGSIVSVEAGLAFSDHLEKTIEKMVEALIGGYMRYSFADWQKQWKAAPGKNGDAKSAGSPCG